jgi:predicted DNA repair protein MutK
MFLVGGGILVHGVPALHHGVAGLARMVATLPGIGGALRLAMPLLLDAATGIVAGSVALLIVTGAGRVIGRRTAGT